MHQESLHFGYSESSPADCIYTAFEEKPASAELLVIVGSLSWSGLDMICLQTRVLGCVLPLAPGDHALRGLLDITKLLLHMFTVEAGQGQDGIKSLDDFTVDTS